MDYMKEYEEWKNDKQAQDEYLLYQFLQQLKLIPKDFLEPKEQNVPLR